MNRSIRISLVCLAMIAVAVIAIAARSGGKSASGYQAHLPGQSAMTDAVRRFADKLDLEDLSTIAVYTEGRIKSFGSHAAAIMHDIAGPHRLNDRDPVFNYLDMMLRPADYETADVLFCKQKLIRTRIADKAKEAFATQLARARQMSMDANGRLARWQIVQTLAPFDARMADMLSGVEEMNRRGVTSPADIVRIAFPHQPGDVRSNVTIDEVRRALAAVGDEELAISRDKAEIMLDMLSNDPAVNFIPEGITERFDARMARFVDTGLLSARLIQQGPVMDLLMELNEDVIKTSRFVSQLSLARHRAQSTELFGALRIIAPAGGGTDDPWMNMSDLVRRVSTDRQRVAQLSDQLNQTANESASRAIESELAVLRDQIELHEQVISQWRNVVTGWESQNAEQVNNAAGRLSAILPEINASLYPSQNKLSLETLYFKLKNLTWIWVIYALGMVPLLMSVVFRWRAARWIGLGLFTLAFLMHTAAILLRWYVSGRWPNSNMFEAITTAAWFGGCLTVLLELVLARTPARGYFALASSVSSMTAMMAVHFMPLQLNPNISNMMPVLHDVWLYIHTNVIIFSYCLVFMAAVSALLYLLYRGGKKITGASGQSDFARVGGAGSLIVTGASGEPLINRMKTNVGQVLDGATMILLEMAFVLLWAGIVMGAIWADHSWGRPWGWDPKEVFALNTFLIFIVLIHVRLKAKDKGMWTAVLAVIGAGVMLFNWTAINFVITGLHSYA